MKTKSPRVLFVDDEPFFARPYIMRLRDAGFEVALCSTVEETLSRVAAGPPIDAMVLDICMPPPEGVSPEECEPSDTGIWLLKRLRALLKDQDIFPILILSLRNPKIIAEHCREIPMPNWAVSIYNKVNVPADSLANYLTMAIERKPRP